MAFSEKAKGLRQVGKEEQKMKLARSQMQWGLQKKSKY